MAMLHNGDPFTRADLPRLGLTLGRLRTLLGSGAVRRLLVGVYVDGAVADSLDLRVRALRLVVSDHQVVVDRTAAWLHGVDTHSSAENALPPVVEICALRGTTRSRHRSVRGRTRTLGPRDVMVVDDLVVTTPLRTALDLGCHLHRREAYAALCCLAGAHDIPVDQLVAGARRFARRRGVVQLRGLVPIVEPRVESHREAWTLLALIDAGLPAPEPQHWVEREGVPTYRLDFAYVAPRVGVEYDGRDGHHTDEQRAHDRERRAWLRAQGWTIIVVRSGDFTGAELDGWIREVRRALANAYSTRRW